MADQVTPFRFFATVLGPDGGRRAFRARLGGEADDVLDTFLSQALAYEAVEPPSLQGFVRFIRANESDIKRETEEAATGVRVMTVHGAKGLEADVVFLVDTGGLIVVPGQRDSSSRSARIATIRRSSGGGAAEQAPAATRRRRDRRRGEAAGVSASALRRDDARARRALRRRHQGRADAAGVLVHAGRQGAGAGGCGARGGDRRARRGLSLAANRRARQSNAGESIHARGSLRCPRRTGCSARRRRRLPRPSRCGPPRRSPSPTRRRMPGAKSRQSPRRAMPPRSAAAPCICCCRFCPGLPRGARAAARRILARDIPNDPDLAGSICREAEAVLADPAIAEAFGRGAAPKSRSSGTSRRRAASMP